VLSGLLVEQERAVLAAHQARGLQVRERIRLGAWATLVLKRTGRRR
jgi:ribosomal protein L11 methyltransferase